MGIDSLKYPCGNMSLEDMEGEIWKDIRGFEGYYMVSNLGRVKSIKRLYNKFQKVEITERIRKQVFERENILRVALYIKGINHNVSVSRLVYSSFISRLSYNGSEYNLIVSHKNNDPRDNRLDNLCLLNRSDHCKKTYRLGISLTPHRKKVSKETLVEFRQVRSKAISQYTRQGIFVRSFEDTKEASLITGILRTEISSCISHKYRSAGGFVWRLGAGKEPLCEEEISVLQYMKINTRKPVNQYDFEGNYITSYPSVGKAAIVANIERRTLSYRLSKGTFACNGYLWRYRTGREPLSKEEISELQNRRFNSPKSVNQYDLEGNYIRTFSSISKAAIAVGLHSRTVSLRLSKGAFSYNGYIWRYADSEEKRKK